MHPDPATSPPTPESDNWDATSLEAPRQRAGDVIEHQSEQADTTTPTTDRDPSTAA